MPQFPPCPRCKRSYDDRRKPLLLPCGHVYCRACLSDMEDKGDATCPDKKCAGGWGRKSLADLPIVYDLIPGFAGNGREVTPAAGARGREITPATRVTSPRATGREVIPLEDDDDRPGSSAASSSGRMSAGDSDFPTCAVCMEDFNNHENRPRLLPCGHVSCQLCLESLENQGDLTCPRCRQVRPKGLISGLPLVRSLVHSSNANKRASTNAIKAAEVLNRARNLQRNWMDQLSDKSDPKKMEIFVKDIRGQIHTFVVNPNTETVLQLRRRLPSPPDNCRYLTYAGRTLENQHVLAHYNVQNHCTIEERGRLQGGC